MNARMPLSLPAAGCLVAAWTLLLAGPAAWAQYPVPVGATHPDFELPRIDGGRSVKLSEYRGRKLLLIHFASW